MTRTLISFLTLMLLAAGCGESESTTSEPAPGGGDTDTSTDLGEPSDPATSAGPGIALMAENTRIQFVGVHVDPAKDDRVGHFGKFSGTAVVEGAALKSVRVDIETMSLTTEIDRLTGHLKSADFFDVNQHPKAVFESTAIEDAGDGTVKITGDLTLLGTTNPVTFSATVTTGGGLKLNAEFEIDRTEFGMTFGQDNVKKMIAMTISVDA